MFPISFRGVYKKIQVNFKKVSNVIQVRLKGVSSNSMEVSRAFEKSLKSMSGKFQWCYNSVSRVVQESLQEIARRFQECFNRLSRIFEEVSRVFQGRLKGVSMVF